MAITDDQGTVTDRYDYDAWGEVYTDLMQNQTGMNPYRYVGELGYHHFVYEGQYELPDILQLGVRFYEPGVGRFGQRDGGPRLASAAYAYSEGSPLIFADADGRTARRRDRASIRPLWSPQKPCSGIHPGIPNLDDACNECTSRLAEDTLLALSSIFRGCCSTKKPIPDQQAVSCANRANTKCHQTASGSLAIREFLDCVAETDWIGKIRDKCYDKVIDWLLGM